MRESGSVQAPERLVVDAAAGPLIEQGDQQVKGALLAADSVQARESGSVQSPEGLVVEAAAGLLVEQADQ